MSAPNTKPRVIYLDKAGFRGPDGAANQKEHAIVDKHVDLTVIASGRPPGIDDGVRRISVVRPRPPILSGLLFFTVAPLLAAIEVARRPTAAVLAKSPYEAFLPVVFRRLAPGRFPPVVVDVHGDWRTASRLYGSRMRLVLAPIADLISRWTVRHADLVRTVSAFVEQLVRRTGYAGSVLAFLPYSDYSIFCSPPTPLPVSPHALFVGSFERYKGVDVLLDAWGLVRERVPMARLTVVGEGTLGPYVRKLVEEQGWSEVIIRERVCSTDLASLLDSATVLVLPSRSEGLGRVVIEAFGRARPIVASDVGGLLELIDEALTGLLVEPENTTAFADATVKVLLDRDFAARMGQAGRKTFDALDVHASYERDLEVLADAVRTLGD